MNAKQIELAVAKYFGMDGMQNRNLIIPNFKGFWVHECDLLIVTPSRWAYEVEIKCTLQDLKADLQKKHHHISTVENERIIKGLYYTLPEELYITRIYNYIPRYAGIFVITDKCRLEHKPVLDKTARKLTEAEYLHLGRILCQRLWKLKRDMQEKL